MLVLAIQPSYADTPDAYIQPANGSSGILSMVEPTKEVPCPYTDRILTPTLAGLDPSQSWHKLNQILETGADSGGILATEGIDDDEDGFIDELEACNGSSDCNMANAVTTYALDVVGISTFSTDLNITNDINIGGSSNFNSHLNIGNNIDMTGLSALASIDSGLVVNNGTTFNNGLNVSNDLSSGVANISGSMSTTTLAVNGDVFSGSYSYSSDSRLKKDIKQIPYSPKDLSAIRGVSFRWKDTGKPQIGLIAQEIEAVYPQLVNTDSETGLKSVQYENIVGLLIEALKSQDKQINSLKKEVALLRPKKLESDKW